MNSLADGTYSNCTIVVRDAFGNDSLTFSIPAFTVDTLAPTLTAGTEVGQNILARDAQYTFSTTEPGSYTLSGCAGSVDGGSHVVHFAGLTPGNYSCTLVENDYANNVSNTITIQSFSIRPYVSGHSAPTSVVSSVDGKLGFKIGTPTIDSSGDVSVQLILNADPATVQGYAVSVDPSFSHIGIVSYSPFVSFVVPKSEIKKPIYLKYYSTTGNPSDTYKQIVNTSTKTVVTAKKDINTIKIKSKIQAKINKSNKK